MHALPAFNEWLLRRGWRFGAPALLAGAGATISLYFLHVDQGNAVLKLSLAQGLAILVCFFLFAFATGPRVKAMDATPDTDWLASVGLEKASWGTALQRATRAIGQLRVAWLWTLALWSLLYLVIFLECLVVESTASPAAHTLFDLAKDILNGASNAALLACYIVLAKRTTDGGHNHFAWLYPILLVPGIEVLLVLAFSTQGYGEAEELAILVFGVVMGVFGGGVLGLLVGRLDSRFLAAPVWVLSALFVYAAIQPLYPVLHGVLDELKPDEDSEWIQLLRRTTPAALIGLAGALKLLMCLFLYHSFKSGRLLYYCVRTRVLTDSVERQWEDFWRR